MAIIFGGRSSEHAISCATAAGVLSAIDRQRFDVVPIGIAKDGSWLLLPDDPAPLRLEGTRLPEVAAADHPAVVIPFGAERGRVLVAPATEASRVLSGVDVVLPLLHGPFGEDGTLQGLLELADLPSSLAARLLRWREGHVSIAIDGSSLVVAASGTRR